jgi:hypothetical protein
VFAWSCCRRAFACAISSSRLTACGRRTSKRPCTFASGASTFTWARGAYAFLGSFSADTLRTSTGSSASDVTIRGWNLGPTAGLDYYISKLVSVGMDVNAEVLFLRRPPIPLHPGQTVAPQYESLYADSGSSIGAGFVGVAHLGIHF